MTYGLPEPPHIAWVSHLLPFAFTSPISDSDPSITVNHITLKTS